jgi:hypothetical protein
MAYLGLVPSVHSSGIRVRRGGIIKAGNAQARRVLIEGAWTYRIQAWVSRKLGDRLEALPQEIRDIASKAPIRLCAAGGALLLAISQRLSSPRRSPSSAADNGLIGNEAVVITAEKTHIPATSPGAYRGRQGTVRESLLVGARLLSTRTAGENDGAVKGWRRSRCRSHARGVA